MLELQERPAAEQPTAGRAASYQPRSVDGLASGSTDEAVPRPRPRPTIPWSAPQQRSLAWANLVTVVGFTGAPFLDKILPAAHAADLMVHGWDFPRLISWEDDVSRAKAAVDHRTPGKQRIDGFAADTETRSEGTQITAEAAADYGRALREAVGSSFPLIATVPRPSPAFSYPYAEVVASFDAVAPMVDWLNRQPDTDVVGALRDLAQYGKPVFPVGQAFDGGPEGGRAGVGPEELWRFMRFAQANGAQGVSFWSWQAANGKAWAAITEAEEFRTPAPWMLKESS